jgi:hypothetical protein
MKKHDFDNIFKIFAEGGAPGRRMRGKVGGFIVCPPSFMTVHVV